MTRPTHLTALADAVLMPCFDGTAAPEWLLRRVHESIGAVCLFARNIGTPEQVRALTDALRAARPDVVIAIDEEAGDVTRLDAADRVPVPGQCRPRPRRRRPADPFGRLPGRAAAAPMPG